MALVTKTGGRYKARFQWNRKYYCKTFDTEEDAEAWCLYIRGGQSTRSRVVSTENLSKVLRDYLNRTNISQPDLALLTGMDCSFLNAIINGKKDTILFDSADRILCKIDEVGRWYDKMSVEYETAFSV